MKRVPYARERSLSLVRWYNFLLTADRGKILWFFILKKSTIKAEIIKPFEMVQIESLVK